MSYQALDAYASVITVDSSIVSGVIQRPIINIGSVLGPITAIFTGSPSISGAVTIVGNPSISGQVGASIIGALPAGNQVIGAVAASISGTVATTLSGNPSISGTVLVNNGSVVGFQGGAWSTSIITGNASLITVNQGSSIIAVVAGSILTIPQGSTITVLQSSSILAVPVGSTITVLQSSSILAVPVGSTITVWKDSSILSIPVGSTITVFQNPSIVGTYAEDAAHTSGDKGVFVLNVRNDTMSSITSADSDYSPLAVGPMGETIVANAPITKWFNAQTSVMYGVSVQGVAAQGASIFAYLTGIQIANDSGTFSRVKITGGLGSVMLWTVAPANGGSNIVLPNPIKFGENSGISASISGVSSVYVSFQGFISKS